MRVRNPNLTLHTYLDTIDRLTRHLGRPPTLQDIADERSITRQAVHSAVLRLREMGELEPEGDVRRPGMPSRLEALTSVIRDELRAHPDASPSETYREICLRLPNDPPTWHQVQNSRARLAGAA